MSFHVRSSLLIALSLAACAVAQENVLDLQQLMEEARRSNPEILAAQKKFEASRQRPRQASSLPDPTLSLGYASNGNPLPGTGVGTQPTSNIGFSFTQEFPYPGKRRLRGEASSKEADAEFEQYRLVERTVTLRLSQAYYRLQHTYPAMDVLDRNHALLQTLLRIVEARYAVGKAAQQDAFKVQTELTILETKKVQLERERRTRAAEINSLLDRPAGAPLQKPGEPHVHELTVPLEDLREQARETAPEVRRDQKNVQRAELEFNLARKEAYPDYAITGGYFYMGSMPAMYQLRADIRVPLYFSRKQRAAITEQAQNVAGARHEYEAANRSLDYRIEDAYLMAQSSYKLMKLYLEAAIPQAHLALRSSLNAYETGTSDFLAVFTNHLAVLEYEMNYHEEMLNYHLGISQLEELTGLKLAQ